MKRPRRSPANKAGKVTPQATEAPLAPEDETYVREAEEAREKVVQEDAAREWQGVPLKPWSEGRARLLDALCAADVPVPEGVAECSAEVFVQALFPRAVKLLYLMHHEPEDWERLRPRLLSVIDAWGVVHVPAETIQDKAEAVRLMLAVEKAHKQVMAMQRPRRVKGDAEGN